MVSRWLIVLNIFASTLGFSQDSASFQNYFQALYNNDTFTGTDYYYTHGIRLTYSHQLLRANPINNLLFSIKYPKSISFGLTIIQDAFTPTRINEEYVRYNDRPFAAYLLLRSSKTALSRSGKLLFTSEFDIGVIGTAACGYAVQSWYHKLIDDKHPIGWKNQIRNDLAINYNVHLENKLYQYRGIFDIKSQAQMSLGTLNTNGSLGLVSRFGELVFGNKPTDTWQGYLKMSSRLTYTGYNATLQGGLFSNENVFFLQGSDLNRITNISSIGLTLRREEIELQHSYYFISSEFKTGRPHKWATVGVKYWFN